MASENEFYACIGDPLCGCGCMNSIDDSDVSDAEEERRSLNLKNACHGNTFCGCGCIYIRYSDSDDSSSDESEEEADVESISSDEDEVIFVSETRR